MRIAVVREQEIGERRVALTPEAAETLVADGHSVVVESGAGVAAGMGDEAYQSAGASVTSEPSALLADGTVVVSVNGPGGDLLSGMARRMLSSAFLTPSGGLRSPLVSPRPEPP